jgi:acyl dehydratase
MADGHGDGSRTTSGDRGRAEPLVHGLGWQDQPVGFRFRTARRTVTEFDLLSFVTMAGFSEGLFLDASEAAASAGYAGRLVPGALVFSLAEGLVIQTHVIAGTGLAYLGCEMKVVGPTYVGDTLEVEVEVTESRATSSGGGERGLVATRNTVRKQDGTVVLEYAPARLVRSSAVAVDSGAAPGRAE